MSNDAAKVERELQAKAVACYQRGNWVQAERVCRFLMDSGILHPAVYTILGGVAAHVGEYSLAMRYIDEALRIDPAFEPAKVHRIAVSEKTARALQPEGNGGTRPRYLLIKAWGYGFWSDIDHVLGALLVAEMTERIPVVYWGTNSLFRADDRPNAFEVYFEPVSGVQIGDLRNPALQFFPPKWSSQNIYSEDVNKWNGSYARMAGFYFLNRSEDVLVSDFHVHVNDMLPWIRESHPLHGWKTLRIYRYLFERYLRIKPAVAQKIDAVWQEKMSGKQPNLAVHIRGSDKVKEAAGLNQLNEEYEPAISELVAQHRNLTIFLLTDDETILEQYRGHYGDRLVYTDSIRSRSDVGVHYQGHSGEKVGMEVITDTYLAARCDYFLGFGRSNVSTTVQHMKDWAPGTYRLLGGNFLLERNLYLHDW